MAKNPETHVNDTERPTRDIRRHLICCGGGGEMLFFALLCLRDALAMYFPLAKHPRRSLEKIISRNANSCNL